MVVVLFLQSCIPSVPSQPPVPVVANAASGAAAQVVYEGQLFVRAPVAEQNPGIGRFGVSSDSAGGRLESGGHGCIPDVSHSGHGTSSSSTVLVPLPPPRHLATVPAQIVQQFRHTQKRLATVLSVMQIATLRRRL